MSKKTIAIDIDDVLAANAEGFIAYSNERWGTKLTVDDYDEHWAQVWKVDNEETERRATEIHDQKIMATYRHFEDAKPVLKELATSHKLVIITSRRRQLLEETTKWINSYFKDIFSEIHFSGIWDSINSNSQNATKAEICREVGADYLIDDQLKHCLAVVECDIEALLFGNYKWNQLDKLPKGVTRVDDWEAVREYFSARS